jgi:hypothetical protein
MIDQIIQCSNEEEFGKRVEAFYNDQIRLWKEANATMQKHIPTKATFIACGQGALVLAAIVVAVLAVGSVLNIL